MMKKIALIYMGGTFGCIGQPLTPMQACEFIPHLRTLVAPQVNCFIAPTIKDSSACNATDWLRLIVQIQYLQQQDYQQFVVIHGTDTLSYAAAVCSHFLAQSAHVIFTGSQHPLLNAQATHLHPQSDALDNLRFALSKVQEINAGVYLAFYQQIFYGISTLKRHISDLDAFTGIATSVALTQPYQHTVINLEHIEKAAHFRCMSLMLQPIEILQQSEVLASLLAHPPHCLILQAFGSGNFAINSEILQLLSEFKHKNCAVILSTQVSNGSLSQQYAVSEWLQNAEIILNDTLSHADLYAKALKMYLQYHHVNQWYQHWSDPA